ncbi:glycosyltransferase family 9 protein [Haloferula sargassicola]|uniref:Uncharacterized protein n=1 Tax=Haloferula sargassicola TaxID=490096 RepID=A0ABP9ULJ0_9BACT
MLSQPYDHPLWIAAPLCVREACFSLPAVRAIADKRMVTLVCHETQAYFWRAADLGEVRPIGRKADKKAAMAALTGASEILLWEAGLLADATLKAGITKTIGPASPELAKHLTHPIPQAPKPGPMEHAVRRYLRIAAELGADPLDRRFFEPIPRPEGELETVVLSPASPFGSHFEWPLERWSELVAELADLKPWFQILAPDSRVSAWAETQGLPVVPEEQIPATLAGCHVMVAADSPWPHVAAAFGATCAVLYGPGEPVLHRPLGQQHLVIRRKAECSPCFAAKCPMDLRCQNDLQVDRVVEALRGLISA